jgi:hypothetical protein
VAQSDATVSLESFVAYMSSAEAESDDNPAYIFETLVDGEHGDLIGALLLCVCDIPSMMC